MLQENNRTEFKAELKKQIPELLILDIMLPEEDGIHILKELREREETSELPIILLTAKSAEYDKIIGLDLGADDYVTKPFSVMELVARVKALLRRSQKKDSMESQLKAGVICMDTKKHVVTVAGKNVSLTLKEYELLEYLMRNKDVVLSRDALLTRIWGYEFCGESRTVDVHIRTLRQKLGEGEKYIETVRGVGYKVTEAENEG